MIEALKTTVVLFGIFAGLGAAIDKLLLPRQKRYLLNKTQDFWFFLEALTFHKLPSKAGEAFLHAKKLIVGEKLLTPLGIARALVFSVFLTTVMFFVGQSAAIIIPQLYDPDGVSLNISEFFSVARTIFTQHLNHLRVYSTNFAFDFLTIICTIFVVNRILNAKHVFQQFLWIVLDIAACVFLFYFCLFLLLNANTLYLGGSIPFGGFHEWLYAKVAQDHIAVLAFWFIPQLLFTSTVFYPTTLYLFFLLSLSLLYMCAQIAKQAGLHLSELSSLGDKTIFFYAGTALGLIMGVINLLLFALTGET